MNKKVPLSKHAELLSKYMDLLSKIESMKIYDGRGKGVDQYECKKCGAILYTRYADKGVTPFTMPCAKTNCQGIMWHNDTLSNAHASCMRLDAVSWVRPSFEQLLQMSSATQEHVLKGGLVLETELDEKPENKSNCNG